MKPKSSDNKPLPPYIPPKVYFLMIRTREQIKKVFGHWNEVPYKHSEIDFKKIKELK